MLSTNYVVIVVIGTNNRVSNIIRSIDLAISNSALNCSEDWFLALISPLLLVVCNVNAVYLFIAVQTPLASCEPLAVFENTLDPPTSDAKALLGVTVLYDEVFLLRSRSREIEVYDSDSLKLLRCVKVKNVFVPSIITKMTSCAKNNCLYISDVCVGSRPTSIHRLELKGNGFLMTKWLVDCLIINGLSMNQNDGNVLATCKVPCELIEYTTHGCIVRKIVLPTEALNPSHGIQINECFIVCNESQGSINRSLLLIDANGHIIRSYDRKVCGSDTREVDNLSNLAADKRGNIFVADITSKSIVVLNGSLSDEGKVIISTSNFPNMINVGLWKLCLDEGRSRLYVTDRNQLLVFRLNV